MLIARIKILIFPSLLYFISCNQIQPNPDVIDTRSYKIGGITIIDSLSPANEFLPFDSLRDYGIMVGDNYLSFHAPLHYGFYPIYLIDNLRDTIHLSKTIMDNPLDTIYDIDFANQKEIEHSLTITVDTSINTTIQTLYYTWYHYLKKDSFMLAKAYPILIRNTGDKPILLDRGNSFRAFLEAKDEKGRWRRAENVLKISCGLDGNLRKGTSTVNILPANGVIIAKMFQQNGDFETDCRLRYQFYNTVSNHYIPSSPNTGHWKRSFYAEHKNINPVYSNIFRMKIKKAQFRKLNDDWFKDSSFY